MATMYLEWGGDLVLNQNGGLQWAVGWDEVRQRIERRLFSCPKETLPDGTPVAADYIFDQAYGVGLPRDVGGPINEAQLSSITQKVMQGVMTDESVDTSVPPTVSLQQIGANTLFLAVGVPLLNGQSGEIVFALD